MASGNDRRSENPYYALTVFEKRTLAEARSFTKKCESKIKKDKANFSEKSYLGLWWDAKGLFNCSDVAEVKVHMERYKKFYEEIDNFSDLVEKNDPESYKRLYDIYKDLEEMERDALRDVENNQSTAICQMLREFLDEKYKLDHNLKKVECIVMKQKMSEIEQACRSSKDEVFQMSKKMDSLIDENRTVRQESDKRLKQVLEEAEEKSEARILEMRKQTDDLRLAAEKRSEAIRRESEEKLSKLIDENRSVRRESDEKLKRVLEEAEQKSEEKLGKLIEENRGIKEIVEAVRREKEEAERRSEAIRLESDERLKRVLEESEERSEARLSEMKAESERYRLEAERIRRESDEKLKQAVEEANRRSEARMQQMAEQNRANLQKMAEMLERMNVT